MSDIKPCPFCGGAEVAVREGATFRWRFAECQHCEARAGEIRCQTLGDGTPDEWEQAAIVRALETWNTRA